MKIIITGGTGLIGKTLAGSLVGEGHEVIILSRNPGKHNLDAGAKLEKWDGKTAGSWSHLIDGADVVVNLAGASIAGEGFPPKRWTSAYKQLIRDSRINAGQAVVAAIKAAQKKPHLLIQSSAVGYYGPCGDQIIIDDSPPGDDFLANVCVDWEGSTAVVEEMGLRRVILRTGVVLSPDGGALPLMLLPFKLFAGGTLGDGKQWIPWIHLADEVRAIRFLMEQESASGSYNLSAPNPLTNKVFTQEIGRVLGRPSFIPAPAFALRLALGETSTIVLDGQRAIPKKLDELGFMFQFSEAGAALADLLK